MRFARSLLIFSMFVTLSSVQTPAGMLEELHLDRSLTPQNFSKRFVDFKFAYRAKIQEPVRFLNSRSGDCDDYATLAAQLLASRGYTPRLFAIRMPGEVHVVCYFEQAGAYLDFNARASGNGLVPCENSAAAIAESVAKSFRKRWTSVTEFTYGDRRKRTVETVLASTRFERAHQVLTASTPAR